MVIDHSNSYPTAVRRGVLCIWISVGLVILLSAGSLIGFRQIPSNGVTLTTNVLTAGLLIFVVVKVGAGRGWARWLYAVLFLFGSAAFVSMALLVPAVFLALPLVLKASGVVQFLLQGVALVLLFTKASRVWFREMKTANAL